MIIVRPLILLLIGYAAFAARTQDVEARMEAETVLMPKMVAALNDWTIHRPAERMHTLDKKDLERYRVAMKSVAAMKHKFSDAGYQ